MQTAFQISSTDNVATALTPIVPGEVRLLGDAMAEEAKACEEIPVGHKLALCDIAEGEVIVKYGVVIGCAAKPVRAGSWVHLHVMRSNYDERSSHLNIETGAPEDTCYE